MRDFKGDFPIFAHHPELVYLDSAASTQKPAHVIDGMKEFMENSYANIHRGSYDISAVAEGLFIKSKKSVLSHLGATESKVIYTYNATYGFNIMIQSLIISGKLKKGDKVILGIAEHNANVVPWLIAQKQHGIEIDFINIDENFDYDIGDFYKKYDQSVKVVSLNFVSNVTGVIYSLAKIKNLLRKDTIFMVDGSQAVPNFFVDFDNLGCDVLMFTGHKVMSDTGIGAIVIKDFLLEQLTPGIGGGGAINLVNKDGFDFAEGTNGREPGTPHIIGAVSLLKAFEYIDSIGGYETIRRHEQELAQMMDTRFKEFGDQLKIIGPANTETKVAVFAFVAKDKFSGDIGDQLAEYNICTRAGGHCTHIFMEHLGIKGGSCRASGYIYNTQQDVEKFFEALKKVI